MHENTPDPLVNAFLVETFSAQIDGGLVLTIPDQRSFDVSLDTTEVH